MFLPLLIAFTLGLVAEPLLKGLVATTQSQWRDHQFRRQTFRIQSSIDTLEANGWHLIPPGDDITVPFNIEDEPDFLSVFDTWFEVGKGTQ